MAYDNNRNNNGEDTKPSFPLGRFSGEGNLTEDPKNIARGDRAVAAFKVAFNSRDYKGHEDSMFIGVTVNGTAAERVLDEAKKGMRVHVEGLLSKNAPWEDKEGNMVDSFSLSADTISESWRFAKRDGSTSRSARRSNDDDDAPRGRSERSSRSSRDEDDAPRGRSERSSRGGDDDEPRARGRSARGADEDDAPRSAGRTRRRPVEDIED